MILFSPFILPEPISNTLEQVGKMTIPLSMILIGSMVASLPLEKMKIYIKNIYLWKAAFYKLFIVPICLLIFFPFQISFSIFMIAVLTSAMPSASTISLYAQKFSADIEFSAYGIMISYAVCIITIPLLYSLLQFLHRFFY